jgi:hypothetical protein
MAEEPVTPQIVGTCTCVENSRKLPPETPEIPKLKLSRSTQKYFIVCRNSVKVYCSDRQAYNIYRNVWEELWVVTLKTRRGWVNFVPERNDHFKWVNVWVNLPTLAKTRVP